MSGRVVVQRPDWGDPAMKWGSAWLKNVVDLAEDKGFPVSDLYADDATRVKVLSLCKRSDFLYFSGVGHGNATTFTGQNQEKIFWYLDNETKGLCKGKHFNFLSCSFGEIGGRWMALFGRAAGVHAYNRSFIFMADESTFPLGVAEPFFDSHVEVDRNLLAGSTHLTAHRNCKKRFVKWILDPSTSLLAKRYLLWDRNHKVFYGKWLGRLEQSGGGCLGQ